MLDRPYHEPIDNDSYGPAHADARHHGDRLVKLVAASVLTRTGEPYFDSLLRLLSAQFEIALGLIGLVEPSGERVETVTVFDRGRRSENFSYALKGTPCETIFSPNQVCVYPSRVADLFPSDEVLDEIGAAGYAGMPLFDRDGNVIGIMALCTGRPIANPEELTATLKVFGRRTSLELEHLIALRTAEREAARIESETLSAETSLIDYVQRLTSRDTR